MKTVKTWAILLLISVIQLGLSAQEARQRGSIGANANTARTGGIKGNIIDNEGGEPLIGVTVRIAGTTIGTQTDIDGNFVFGNVVVGKYDIILSYVSYQTDTLRGIDVQAGQVATIQHKMLAEGVKLEGVEIVAERTSVATSDISIIAEMRTSNVATTGISSQMIARSLDRDAGEVVRRTPGVTIIGERFLVVRGMNDRYNSVFLNDVATPSFESDRRSFSFDVIPSSLLDKINVYKAPSPDLPADFAGGTVKIYTKNTSDNRRFVLSLGVGYRAGTTFDTYKYQERSGTDLLGADYDFRRLPSSFPSTDRLQASTIQQRADFGRQLSNTWAPLSGNTFLDSRILFAYYDSWNIGGKKLRSLTTINHTRTFEVYEKLVARAQGLPLIPDDYAHNYQDVESSENARLSLLQNFTLVLNTNNKLEFKNFLTQTGSASVTEREGKRIPDLSDQQTVFPTFLYYQTRFIYSGQFSGTHYLGEKKHQLDWGAGMNYVSNDQPDFRRYEYRTLTPGSPKVLIIQNPAAPLYNERFFSELTEYTYTGLVNYKHVVNENLFVKVGSYNELTNRTFNNRVLAVGTPLGSISNLERPINEILSPSNYFSDGTGLVLTEVTVPSDNYKGTNRINALYAVASIDVFNKNLNIYGGVRYEDNQIAITSRIVGGKDTTVTTGYGWLLPSLNMTYKFSEKTQLRASYGQTVNRPQLREASTFQYLDPILLVTVAGGADSVKTALIHNLDLKLELFPKLDEVITLGVFYKQFNNPIELQGVNSGSGFIFKYTNATRATNYGAELEIRKSLGFLGSAKFFQDLSGLLNLTYIVSEVDQSNIALGQQELKRPLVGQSPYTINAGLFYNNETSGTQVNVLYFVNGPRLNVVGTGTQPGIWEAARNILDFSFTQRLTKKLQVKLGIQDILNNPIRYWQNWNTDKAALGIEEYNPSKGDNLFQDYKPGAYYTLAFNYTF